MGGGCGPIAKGGGSAVNDALAPTNAVRAAWAIAFLLAAYQILAAFVTGPIACLPFAAIPLIAGIGILRKRVWSAYGYALLLTSQLLLVPVLLMRRGNSSAVMFSVLAVAVLTPLLILLFVKAGRILQASGARGGLAWPWIAISLLLSMPAVFVEAFNIPTTSMENTLLSGDRVLVER
jgi:hypothetical protein